MKAKIQFLSDEEKKSVHTDALRILAEVGVKFPFEPALAVLEKGGAVVDYDKQTARISEAMVDHALSKTPKTVLFGARDPDMSFELPTEETYVNLDGCGIHVYDYKSGTKRGAVLSDVADAAKVFDALPLGKLLWPPLSPEDVASGPRSIISTAVTYLNSSKHVMDEVKSVDEIKYVIELSKAIAGSMEEMRKNPMYSVTYCTVSPLSHDEEMLEATMEISKYGVPVLIYPMSATGTTGPGSLSSNIAMAIAEELSAIVLFQLNEEGCPLVFGGALAAVDLKSGQFTDGMPETTLMLCALQEMYEYYKMPGMMSACGTDSKKPDMQSGIEKMMTTLPLILGGGGLMQGIGMSEGSMTLSLEQMVIDHEMVRLCKRIRDGIDFLQDKDFFDDIREVGPEGHFLARKNTRKSFRSSEFARIGLMERGSYEDWEAAGKPDLWENAHKKVLEILTAEQRMPMDPNLEKTIREIMEEARAILSVKDGN